GADVEIVEPDGGQQLALFGGHRPRWCGTRGRIARTPGEQGEPDQGGEHQGPAPPLRHRLPAFDSRRSAAGTVTAARSGMSTVAGSGAGVDVAVMLGWSGGPATFL